MPTTAPYGSWRSPITAELIASSQVGLGQIALDGEDVYWVEARPAEQGRCVVVRSRRGSTTDITPAPFSARSRVHEYGGGAFAVRGGEVCFTHFADQQVYLQSGEGAPRALTSEEGRRFTDFAFDPGRPRIFAVCEDHTGNDHEPRNTLVSIALDGSGSRTLAEGHDFFSTPRPSPDGKSLAWLTWELPNMPWDGSQLWAASIGADGSLGEARCVAGGAAESIVQPEWAPDGNLVYISDRSGWWNLYKGGVSLCASDADFGLPHWIFGQSTYAFASADRIVCVAATAGVWRIGTLTARPGSRMAPYDDLPFTAFYFVRSGGGRIVCLAAGPTEPAAVISMDADHGAYRVLRRSSDIQLDAGYISAGTAVDFPTAGGVRAHAFFYAPRNRDFVAPAGEKPPLLVMSHGGPTSATSNALSPRVQYWTSRGVAVLDVNYRGSTGYGRAYREMLNGQWGVADVDDCVHGALDQVAKGKVDGDRLAITGGSAGGYTTLCALTFRDVFKAGASYYGISDLEALARDTHKFESRYEDKLVGPYPERRDLYVERSPIHFTDRLSCPMILLQGLDDKVVPPNQAEMMVEALRAKGLAVEYIAFEGEGHGFRKADTIKRALEAELAFYGRVFDFEGKS